jgi:hypothetical protein
LATQAVEIIAAAHQVDEALRASSASQSAARWLDGSIAGTGADEALSQVARALLDLASQQAESAHALYNLLNDRPGIAELEYLRAEIERQRCAPTAVSDDGPNLRASAVQAYQRSVADRLTIGIAFRRPELYLRLGLYYEQSGHYPRAAAAYEACAEEIATLVGATVGDRPAGDPLVHRAQTVPRCPAGTPIKPLGRPQW